MKIIKTAPQNAEIYSHEAPTAKVLIGLTWFFVAVSAMTVTAAWNVYLKEILVPLGWLRWPVLILWGLIFVLPIEVMIFELSKFFWRSIVKGYHKGEGRGQFITGAILLGFGLIYSVFMSQTATKTAMESAASDERLIDDTEVQAAYRSQVRQINSTYNDHADQVEKRYAELSKATILRHEATLDSLQKEHEYYTKKGPERFQWKLSTISRAMSAAENSKAAELSKLSESKAAELSKLASDRDSKVSKAEDLRGKNMEILEGRTTASNGRNEWFTFIFSTLVSGIAALAVLFVFLLARFIELFYHRTGMQRIVLSENADLWGSAAIDLLRFPFVYASRHLGQLVHEAYKRLPDPQPPHRPEVLYDPTGVKQEVVNAYGSTAATMNARAKSAGAAKVFSVPVTGIAPQPVESEVDCGQPQPTPPPAQSKTPPPTDLSSLEPLSLKSSKPKGGSAAKMPDGIEEVMKKAWKNPVAVPGFYQTLDVYPGDYQTAHDYLEKLKKTARNCATAAHRSSLEDTRRKNRTRLDLAKAELGRMCVDVVEAVPGSVSFGWLHPEGGAAWEERIRQMRV